MVPTPRSVVLWSRPGCHLCDDARTVVASVCARAAADFEERSILTDAHAFARFAELVPVVEVDGEVVATWRVDAADLRALLGA